MLKYNLNIFARASKFIAIFSGLLLPFLIYWIANKSTVVHLEAGTFLIKTLVVSAVILVLLGIRKLVLIALFVARGK